MAAKIKNFALRMSPSLYSEIQKLAVKDRSMNKIILDAIDQYLGNMAIQQEAKEAVEVLRSETELYHENQTAQIKLALIALEEIAKRIGISQLSEFIKSNRGE